MLHSFFTEWDLLNKKQPIFKRIVFLNNEIVVQMVWAHARTQRRMTAAGLRFSDSVINKLTYQHDRLNVQ